MSGQPTPPPAGDTADPGGTRWPTIALTIVGGGIAAGILASALQLLLHAVAWIAFGSSDEPAITGTDPVAWLRRFAGPVLGGVACGFAWWGIRRHHPGPQVTAMLQSRQDAPQGVARSLLDAATQVVIVGSGASIGREGAPRLAAAAVVEGLTWHRLSAQWRRVLIAAAAGAGLAAVYNVPLSGVIFAVAVLLSEPPGGGEADMRGPRHPDHEPAPGRLLRLRSGLRSVLGTGWSVQAVVCAATMSLIATVVAWPVVGNRPLYHFPGVDIGWDDAVFAVVVGVGGGVIGHSFGELSRRVRKRAPAPGWRLPVGIGAVGALLGLASFWVPVAGNGILLVRSSFEGTLPVWLLIAFVALKPVVTGLYIRAGAVGGLLHPALAVGAALGALGAIATGDIRPASFALIGAVAVLAASERSWLFAAALGWELTHAPLPLLACLLVSAAVARAVGWAITQTARARHRAAT